MARVPIVFISSTSEDLNEHRQQAAKAARALGFKVEMMEDFSASGLPSLDECRKRVAEADVVVAIVAHRYGWVPNDTGQPDAKSITWLECEHAWNVTRKDVLGFVVDPKAEWPATLYESYRLVTERKSPGIQQEVERNEANLKAFMAELGKHPWKQFHDAPTLRALVGEALSQWLIENPQITPPATPGDPEGYLQALFADTCQIRIMKLKSKRAEPYVFDIGEIYIPLTTLAATDEKARLAGNPPAPHRARARRPPAQGCHHRRSRLRQIHLPQTHGLRTLPQPARDAAQRRAAVPRAEDRRFPILIRTADLTKLLAADASPIPPDAPHWLPYFLGRQSAAYGWGVDEAFFRRKLEEGGCLVMVDGLDEAPDRRLRRRVARLFEKATAAYAKCDFLVTTRPQSYEGDSVLEGFYALRIGDLEAPEIKTFFQHFRARFRCPSRRPRRSRKHWRRHWPRGRRFARWRVIR